MQLLIFQKAGQQSRADPKNSPKLSRHLSHLCAAPITVLALGTVQLHGALQQGTAPAQPFSTYFAEISTIVIKWEITDSSRLSANG